MPLQNSVECRMEGKHSAFSTQNLALKKKLEDVLMSEMERKRVEDVDTIVDVMAKAQEKDRKRVVPVEDQTEGRTAEHWAAEMIREFDADAKRWHRRQGWGALGLACFHGLSVAACCAALLGSCWQLVLVGLTAANLLMVGGWLHKAKAGWDV